MFQLISLVVCLSLSSPLLPLISPESPRKRTHLLVCATLETTSAEAHTDQCQSRHYHHPLLLSFPFLSSLHFSDEAVDYCRLPFLRLRMLLLLSLELPITSSSASTSVVLANSFLFAPSIASSHCSSRILATISGGEDDDRHHSIVVRLLSDTVLACACHFLVFFSSSLLL